MNCAPADHTPSSEPALARARRVCFPGCAWEAGSHGRQSDQGSGVPWRSDLRWKGQALRKLLLHAAWDRNPAGQQTVDPDLLTAPFTLAEAKTAIAGMNKNSARGLMASARHSTVLRGITSHPGLSTSWHSMTTMSTWQESTEPTLFSLRRSMSSSPRRLDQYPFKTCRSNLLRLIRPAFSS